MKDEELKTKEGELGLINDINDTKNATLETEEQKKEREITKVRKELFLEHFQSCRCIVSRTCAKVGIKTTKTFYRWLKADKEFAEKVIGEYSDVNLEIRDALLDKILVERDGPSIRYWLDRKDPEFMPKSKTEVITGNRTLEDLLLEDEEELNKKENEQLTSTTTENPERPEISDREVIQDTKQEGADSTIQVQPSPELLLEKENEKKPDSESETKGNIESDRRRPAPRVREERY